MERAWARGTAAADVSEAFAPLNANDVNAHLLPWYSAVMWHREKKKKEAVAERHSGQWRAEFRPAEDMTSGQNTPTACRESLSSLRLVCLSLMN